MPEIRNTAMAIIITALITIQHICGFMFNNVLIVTVIAIHKFLLLTAHVRVLVYMVSSSIIFNPCNYTL